MISDILILLVATFRIRLYNQMLTDINGQRLTFL